MIQWPTVNPTGTISLVENLERVQSRVQAAQRRAGRTGQVTLVAVSKGVPAERIAEAYRAGVRHFGENRVQEFEEKRHLLTLPAAVWHLVGHLQTNKVKRAAQLFSQVDSVDSLRLAEKLSAAATAERQQLPVLIQVHLGEEASKSGVEPAELVDMVERLALLEGVTVQGLMTIPPFLDPPERVRPFFRNLRELAEAIDRRQIPGVSMVELSMGMSHDFEVGVEEGATQVRLGTAVFGERSTR